MVRNQQRPPVLPAGADPSEAAVLQLARMDLACYAIASYPGFELADHLRIIVAKLEAVERGEIRRLILSMPPRHGKSLVASRFFPAWYLGRHPERSVIAASYGQELANDFGRAVRDNISAPVHSAIFPDSRLSSDSAAVHRFSTTKGGTYFAVGRGGAITGRGGHLLLIDDPINGPEEAASSALRRSLQSWYVATFYTRSAPAAAIVLIQTRWHEDDLAGWLIREHPQEKWDVVSLPAIAEQDEGFRREGEALWPSKFPLEELQATRRAIGGAAFASLYQQRPAAAEGRIFKREWWQRFAGELPKVRGIVQSWDTAFKAGAENDYSACTTWAETKTGYYLLHAWRGRVEFPELKRRLVSFAEEWRPHSILIEDKASGQSLIQELQRGTRLAVLPVKVDADKVARAQAVTPLVEAGKVFLPERAPWLDDYLDELSAFPAAAHDDFTDSTTQALNYMREHSSGSWENFVPYVEQRPRGTIFESPRNSDDDSDDEGDGFRRPHRDRDLLAPRRGLW